MQLLLEFHSYLYSNLSIRKPWSIWGPNILHAWDKTSKCMILSGKRELSNATLLAVCETIALAVSKPQRRNARSVNTPYPLWLFFFRAPRLFYPSREERLWAFLMLSFRIRAEYSGCVGEVAKAFQRSTVKWKSQAAWLSVPSGSQVTAHLQSFHFKLVL